MEKTVFCHLEYNIFEKLGPKTFFTNAVALVRCKLISFNMSESGKLDFNTGIRSSNRKAKLFVVSILAIFISALLTFVLFRCRVL